MAPPQPSPALPNASIAMSPCAHGPCHRCLPDQSGVGRQLAGREGTFASGKQKARLTPARAPGAAPGRDPATATISPDEMPSSRNSPTRPPARLLSVPGQLPRCFTAGPRQARGRLAADWSARGCMACPARHGSLRESTRRATCIPGSLAQQGPPGHAGTQLIGSRRGEGTLFWGSNAMLGRDAHLDPL